jgi:hypothetical protein
MHSFWHSTKNYTLFWKGIKKYPLSEEKKHSSEPNSNITQIFDYQTKNLK